ncbi:hypothetical protein SELMODRAFT_118459 [Selaginella moellendorffii]|uniref:C2H2-type domain-containing protein n=1 Tax=Selaginella moellendorffii TaxID=88036 RepID=D8SJT3_SELML|nr:hypothetical protein SELMODRAFT_118459 [Selaginella moellendorffii]
MGRCPNHKKPAKKKYSHKSARRAKFLARDDMIYSEVKNLESSMDEGAPARARDEDLPGMGQFYCLHCDRYFSSSSIMEEHFKTKRHKKRVKAMQGPAPHCQLDAELAAGQGKPDNGPKLGVVSS